MLRTIASSRLAAPALLVGLIAAMHAWGLGSDYAYDDQPYIMLNEAIHAGLSDWTRFFTDASTYSSMATHHYRPFVTISFAFNEEIGGGVLGNELAQLGLHILTALALFWLLSGPLRRFYPVPAGVPMTAALLVGVMPFNVETVQYMTARSALLCGLFSVLSVGAFLEGRGQQRTGRAVLWFAAHFGFLVIALLSKETAITVPAAVLAADLLFVLPASGIKLRSLRFFAPYLPYLAGAVIMLSTFNLFGMAASHFSQVLGEEWRLATAIYCLVENVRLMVLPTGLTVMHPINHAARLLDTTTLVCGLLVGTALVTAWRVRRSHPLIGFGIAWYFLAIAPSTFVHLNTILLENRGYSASLAVSIVLAVLLVAGWRETARYRIPVWVVSGIGVVCLVLLSVAHQRVWENNISLWEDAVKHEPRSVDAWVNLGGSYILADRKQDGEQVFRRLVKQVPDAYRPRYNLARVLVLQGRHAEALPWLEQLEREVPDDPNLLGALSEVYQKLGRERDERLMLTRLLAASNKNLETRRYANQVNLPLAATRHVLLTVKAGRLDEAWSVLARWRMIQTDHPQWYYLAMRLHSLAGEWDQAARTLDELATLMPGDPIVGQWRGQLADLRRQAAGEESR